MIRHWYISGRYFGSTPYRPEPFIPGWGQPSPRSLLFYCGECGEIVARLPIMGVDGKDVGRWDSRCVCCIKCSDGPNIPGSIYPHFNHHLQLQFPLSLLHYEVELHLNYAERKLNGRKNY